MKTPRKSQIVLLKREQKAKICRFFPPVMPQEGAEKEDLEMESDDAPPIITPQVAPHGRSVGSLVLLTQKFVNLMKENNGHIDLRRATEILEVQKRRIYDITNVLEGVGLIEKMRHSSIVKWKGCFNDKEDNESLQAAFARTTHLVALEADLDIQLKYASRNLKFVQEDATNKSYAYVTRDDLLSIYGDNVVFTIPAEDKEVKLENTNNSLYVSLDNGSTIDVRLVTDQGNCIASKLESDSALALSILELPPVSLSPSVSHSKLEIDSKCHQVTDEHTYSCNPELKQEMDELENELTSRIILQSCTTGHSLRRYFPDDPYIENAPLVQLNPPQNDYSFVLGQDEGVCELFDIPVS